MTALTKERDTPTSFYDYVISLPGKGNVKIYNGGMVSCGSDGYAVAASDTANTRVRGRASASMDTTVTGPSGLLGDGVAQIEVLVGHIELANPAGTHQLTVADLGKTAYVVDDQTVARATGTANAIPAGVVISVDVTNAKVVIDQRLSIAEQATASRVAPVADNAVSPAVMTGALEIVFPILLPDAATADYDFVMPFKAEMIDATIIKDGAGAANTLQFKNGAGTAITDAIAAAVDKAVTRAGTCDKATRVLAAAAVLRLTNTRAAGSSALAAFPKFIRRT